MKKFYRYTVCYWQDHYDADGVFHSTPENKVFYDLYEAHEFVKSIIDDENATLSSIQCVYQYTDWPNLP